MIVEPLVGYRIFRAYKYIDGSSSNALSPLYIGGVAPYKPGLKMEAGCAITYQVQGRFYTIEHQMAPFDACNCGIYAYKDITNGILPELGHILRLGWTNLPMVVAKVNLWGKIQEHQNGFRAQFCYPDKFLKSYSSLDVSIQSLSSAWGVEVE